jgi:23S rRNA (guanosine2251-2'-O)-methyltransferase
MAVIMGAEGDGMRALTKKHCDFLARLETSKLFSTLNVSNAAAITLHEAFKGQQG